MSISKRKVKNKKKENGLPSGKEGVVYDVFLKYKNNGSFKSYCQRGFLTKAEAKSHESAARLEFIDRARGKDGHQRLDEYLSNWLACGESENRWKLNTLSGYKNNIRKYILPICGHLMLRDIIPEHCDQILRVMKFKGLADATIRYVRQTLSAALSDACSYNYINHNPVDNAITKLKESNFSPSLYDIENIACLMNASYDTHWEGVFLLTGMYGLRRSEALGLKWKNIDFSKREILIEEQLSSRAIIKQTGEFASALKTPASKRKLYLSNYAMTVLVRQMDRYNKAKANSTKQNPFQDRDYVIHQNDGLPYNETHLGRQFHSFTDDIDLPRCRIHDLRHSTATNIYYLTSDYLAVAKILGHSIRGLSRTLGGTRIYESTTSTYIHVHYDKEIAAIKSYHEAVEFKQTKLNNPNKVVSINNFRR